MSQRIRVVEGLGEGAAFLREAVGEPWDPPGESAQPGHAHPGKHERRPRRT
jgi:hypothetical protein